jgi:hypothetical protein
VRADAPVPVPGELLRWLRQELRLFGERSQHLPVSRWATPAAPFATRADTAFHLAAVVAGAALAVEGQPFRSLPRLDPVVTPDQIDVVGRDLTTALADPREPVDWCGRRWDAAGLTAAVLAEVLLHRTDLDGSPPPPAALAVLRAVPDWARIGSAKPDPAAAFRQLARRRCPGPPGAPAPPS